MLCRLAILFGQSREKLQVVQVVLVIVGTRRVVGGSGRRILATARQTGQVGVGWPPCHGTIFAYPRPRLEAPVDPPRLILASASAGRLRLLRRAGFDPEVIVSGVDESSPSNTDPAGMVRELALAKTSAVAGEVTSGLVIGADSLLDLDGAVLGKPTDIEDARERWATLAGRSGVLRTGQAVLLVRDGVIRGTDVCAAATTVHFARPDPAELEAYLNSGEPVQVAGAFTIDGLGGQFVDSIDGDVGTVIGLSLPLLRAQAARLGVRLTDLWSARPTRSSD